MSAGTMVVFGVLMFAKPFFVLHMPDHTLGLFGRIRFEMNGMLLYSLGRLEYYTPSLESLINLPPVQRAAFFFYSLPGFAFSLFFYQFYRLMHSVEKGRPFVPENAKRLTIMGLVPIILSIAIQLVRVVAALISEVISDITFSIELGGIFFGLVLLILARIFKHGKRLQDEYDATL